MKEERKRMKFEILLERYFSNFHRILLTNIIFAVPCAFFGVLIYLICSAFSYQPNVFVWMLVLVAAYPFYSGVVTVTRNIARGDENVRVLPVFFKSVRDNFLPFLLHGALLYLACVFSYYSLTLYLSMLSISWLFYVALFICLLVVIAVFFSFFYIPLMSVTYDLPLRYVYKNSFLMSFGELKNNFFALICIAVVAAISFTITIFCTTVTALIIVLCALFTLILPSTVSFVESFFIYDGMHSIISHNDERAKEISDAINNGGKVKTKPKTPEITADDFSGIDISSLKDTDDYIYFNGKMMKQSAVLKYLKENENQEGKNQ